MKNDHTSDTVRDSQKCYDGGSEPPSAQSKSDDSD